MFEWTSSAAGEEVSARCRDRLGFGMIYDSPYCQYTVDMSMNFSDFFSILITLNVV